MAVFNIVVMLAVANCSVVVMVVVAELSAVAIDLSALSVVVCIVLVVFVNEVAKFDLIDLEIAFLVCCSTLGIVQLVRFHYSHSTTAGLILQRMWSTLRVLTGAHW